MTGQQPPREFRAILMALSEVYHRDVSDVEAGVQWEALKDIPIPSIQRAAMALIKSSKYFPVPAAIREQVRVQAPLVDTIGPPPKEIKLLADVRSQRRAERADPAVGVAMALKAAWDEREKMQAAGVPEADLAKGLPAISAPSVGSFGRSHGISSRSVNDAGCDAPGIHWQVDKVSKIG